MKQIGGHEDRYHYYRDIQRENAIEFITIAIKDIELNHITLQAKTTDNEKDIATDLRVKQFLHPMGFPYQIGKHTYSDKRDIGQYRPIATSCHIQNSIPGEDT